jgi:hypothetical protein
MTRHCVAVNNRKWERSEDDRLRRLVAHCRINDFIPWAKVSFYMERRTKEQCYQRYVYSLKDSIRRGAFTDAEDMILIIGNVMRRVYAADDADTIYGRQGAVQQGLGQDLRDAPGPHTGPAPLSVEFISQVSVFGNNI